jgi:hypothetical protein
MLNALRLSAARLSAEADFEARTGVPLKLIASKLTVSDAIDSGRLEAVHGGWATHPRWACDFLKRPAGHV